MADPDKKSAAATAATSKKDASKPSESKATTAKADVAKKTKGETALAASPSLRDRFLAWPMWLRITALVVVALIIIGLIWWLVAAIWPNRPTGSSGTPDGTAANALSEATGTVEPAVVKGVTSWTTWGKASLTNSDMEASMIEAHKVKYHKYYALMLEGEKKGKSYKKLFKKGTRFINCDYNVVNDGHYTFFWDTLDKDTWMLTFPDGTPAVKMTCGNTVIFGRPGNRQIEKSVVKPKEVKGPDKTHGAARQKLRDNHAVRSGTPGYAENGDEVAKAQQSSDTGNNGQAGHSGTGSGGTTAGSTNSSGETNNGGGATNEDHAGDTTKGSISGVD
jgi:hypothetical protein